MRYVWITFAFVLITAVSILGFRGSNSKRPPLEVFPDMDRQPKYKPQAESDFFANGMTDRPLPANVVSRGRTVDPAQEFLGADDHMYRGLKPGGSAANGDWARGFPEGIELNEVFLKRGQERFTLFCTPCHGRLGDGNGITKQYGMGATPSYHIDLIRNQAEGEIFNTITNGKNTMLGYGDRIPPRDRWAIIAYVRALQRAHQGTTDDVPPANRSELGL
jgi:mono/diheme cytochrome c family protein